jgi:flagellar capping protein FliD
MDEMAYPIAIALAPKQGWFTPAESNAYYATRYDREGITIHWWGDGTGADNHDNIVNYMNNQAGQGIKSVNYVVSDNKITMCVSPENVAWCSNNGNPTTISIECQPTLGPEGYKRVGWLVAELERKFGRTLSIYGHNHWTTTSCPGSLDLGRIRAEANGAKSTGQVTQLEDEMIVTRDQAVLMYQLLRPNGGPSEDEINATVNKRTFAGFLRDGMGELTQRNMRLQAQANNINELQSTIAQLRQAIADDGVKDTATLNDYKAKLNELTAEISGYQKQLAELQTKIAKNPVVSADQLPVEVKTEPLPVPAKSPLLVRILAILFAKKS